MKKLILIFSLYMFGLTVMPCMSVFFQDEHSQHCTHHEHEHPDSDQDQDVPCPPFSQCDMDFVVMIVPMSSLTLAAPTFFAEQAEAVALTQSLLHSSQLFQPPRFI